MKRYLVMLLLSLSVGAIAHASEFLVEQEKKVAISVDEEEVCAICLESMDPDTVHDNEASELLASAPNRYGTIGKEELKVITLKACGHSFHGSCINGYRVKGTYEKFACPLCRRTIHRRDWDLMTLKELDESDLPEKLEISCEERLERVKCNSSTYICIKCLLLSGGVFGFGYFWFWLMSGDNTTLSSAMS